MPKYWLKNYFAHGRFPEVGQKQKTVENTRSGLWFSMPPMRGGVASAGCGGLVGGGGLVL